MSKQKKSKKWEKNQQAWKIHDFKLIFISSSKLHYDQF